MTSPYIEREAGKLRLVHPAPPSGAGAAADDTRGHLHYPRGPREAGSAYRAWDAPIKPIRPIWFFGIAAGCWILFGLAIAAMLSIL